MRVTQFNTIYQITFMPELFPVNCYLVEEEDDLTLVDTGLSSSPKSILKVSDSLNKPITRIVLTHPHSDHIGGLDILKEELPAADVYISRRDSSLMQGDFSLKKGEPNMPIQGGFAKNLKTFPDILIKDGDKIGSLTAILAPGHTPGSTVFYDPRSKVLITGDAFQTKGGLAVAGDKRMLFPFPAMATWNKKLSIQTAKELNKLDIDFLAPGHGNVLENPTDLVSEAISRAEEKEGIKNGKSKN